eukprot:evm.model.NODE_29023_length_11471_cov_27.058233.1
MRWQEPKSTWGVAAAVAAATAVAGIPVALGAVRLAASGDPPPFASSLQHSGTPFSPGPSRKPLQPQVLCRIRASRFRASALGRQHCRSDGELNMALTLISAPRKQHLGAIPTLLFLLIVDRVLIHLLVVLLFFFFMLIVLAGTLVLASPFFLATSAGGRWQVVRRSEFLLLALMDAYVITPTPT